LKNETAKRGKEAERVGRIVNHAVRMRDSGDCKKEVERERNKV
jgi:hypothetical protein